MTYLLHNLIHVVFALLVGDYLECLLNDNETYRVSQKKTLFSVQRFITSFSNVIFSEMHVHNLGLLVLIGKLRN